MRFPIRYLPAVALLLTVSGNCFAQEDGNDQGDRADQSRQELRQLEQRRLENERAYRDQRRQIQELQDAARAEPVFSDEQRQQVLRRQTAAGLMRLAENLQNLYDLGHTRYRDGETQADSPTLGEVVSLKQDSLARIGQLLNFVNVGTTPPPTDTITIPEASFEVRVADLSNLFRQFLTPMATLIIGDILDLKMLEQVRSDLAMMDVMVRTVPEFKLR